MAISDKPIRLPNMGAQIAAIMEEKILQNVYPIGSKLPPERRLAEEFDVSRQSVRAALRVLATRGMIESRHGDGHYVSQHIEENFQFGWEDLLNEHRNLEHDLLDFRRGIEGMMASLAAQRRTEEDLNRMHYWLNELRRSYEEHQVEQQSAADVAFHQVIAESAHNLLFTRLSDSLLRLLHRQTRQNIANLFGTEDRKRELLTQHEAIFTAILQQDSRAARHAAYLHLDYVRDHLQHNQEKRQHAAVSAELSAADKRKHR